MFTKSKEKAAQAQVEAANRIEINRRGWCIAQALMLDETRSENLVSVAERIYEYVYGARS